MTLLVYGYIVVSAIIFGILILGSAVWFIRRKLNDRQQLKQAQKARQKADKRARTLFDQAEDKYRHDQYKNALKSSGTALKHLDGTEDMVFKARVLCQMGRIYGAMQDFDRAARCTTEAQRILKLSAFKDNPLFESLEFNQKTWADEKKAAPIRALIKKSSEAAQKGERDSALAYATQAMEMVRRTVGQHNHWVSVAALYHLARAQIANGLYAEARDHLELASGLADEWLKHIGKNAAVKIEQLLTTCNERLGF